MRPVYIFPHTTSQLPITSKGTMAIETLVLNLGTQAAAALTAALMILTAARWSPTATASTRPLISRPAVTNADTEDH